MVSVLDSRLSGPGSRPGRGHCLVLMDKTLNSHSTSLHPVPANLMLGVTLRWSSIPSRWEYKHSQSLHAMENRDKLWRGEPHGSYADFTFIIPFALIGYKMIIAKKAHSASLASCVSYIQTTVHTYYHLPTNIQNSFNFRTVHNYFLL